MCLIITTFAAIISAILWYFNDNLRKHKIGMLALMYWGAALMWLVDSFFSIAEGGTFFELSMEDLALGLVIIICGLSAWFITVLVRDQKHILKMINQTR